MLTTGATAGDSVDIVAYGTFVVADTYTKSQADARYVEVAGDTMTGSLNVKGDISFYEDTGTTPKFVWSAADEALTIGDAATQAPLSVESNSSGFAISIEENAGAETWQIGVDVDGDLNFHNSTLPTPQFTVSDSGNVGIGTGSPASTLHVQTSGSTGFRLIGSTTGANTIYMGDTASGSAGYIQYNNNADYMRFATSGSEAMRINSSGNLEMTGGGSVGWANWTITESGGSLYFATGGANKMKLDASGNLDVVGNVNSNATIT